MFALTAGLFAAAYGAGLQAGNHPRSSLISRILLLAAIFSMNISAGTGLQAAYAARETYIRYAQNWDAEEDQLNGSAYYRDHPLVPHAAVKGYINFDIQGADLLSSLKNVSFAWYTIASSTPGIGRPSGSRCSTNRRSG